VSAQVPNPADFRVADQSNRRWAYGFIRMAPFMLWVAGICMLALLMGVIQEFAAMGLILAPIFLIVPLIIDRSPLLDPVDYVNFGECVMVKRLASQRSYVPERIHEIEFKAPPHEDYDDLHAGRRCTDVTIRLVRAWPARLLAKHEDAIAIACWANARRVRVVEPSPPSPEL
jgi:hypothetical protein